MKHDIVHPDNEECAYCRRDSDPTAGWKMTASREATLEDSAGSAELAANASKTRATGWTRKT